MELKLWLTTAGTNVQGPQLLTDPVAPLQSKAVILPFPSGFTPDGQRQLVLNLQAIGLLGGCNTGSLQGWAGSLDISFVQ